MSALQVMINGQLIAEDNAALGINDLSIVRGYGIFDFFKTVNGTPIFWEDNLDRFFHSAQLMDLPVKYSREELKSQIRQLMEANDIPDSGIKLLLTGGYSSDGYSIAAPNLIITQHAVHRHLENEQKGIKLITFDYHRAFGTVKTIDYVMGIQAMKKAKAAGVADVVYCKDGLLSECPRANIFLVTKEGKLITPEKDVLGGITKLHILKMITGKFVAEQRDVTTDDMQNAAEAFVCSTTKNITPVLAIDNIVYGTEPGPITRVLQEMLEYIVYSE